MGPEIDLRIVKVSIEIRGQVKTYEGIDIRAAGTKYASANQNECEIRLTNLTKATSDYILAETSAYNFNRTPKIVTLEAGRQSYGTSKIFTGNVISSVITEPPDKTVILKCLTADFFKGIVTTTTGNTTTNLSEISKKTADSLNMPLEFQAQDKQVANYSYSGPAAKQVDGLNNISTDVVAYIDDNKLVVKNARTALRGGIPIISRQTGMIGIPEITVWGVKVKYLLDSVSRLGGGIRVQSIENPAANGDYTIFQLGFEVTNRDKPFYWIAEAMKQ